MSRSFWFLLYNVLGIPLQYAGFQFLRLFSSKVRKGVAGRKHLWETLDGFRESRNPDRPLYIVHCASLGEYEMAKPVIEGLRRDRPDSDIILTFFSPSGLEKVDNSSGADLITYLPFDSVRQITRFYQMLRPDKLILVSYEIWPNLIWIAERYRVETSLISARYQGSGMRSRRILESFYRAVYSSLTYLYPISPEDEAQFQRCLNGEDGPQIKTLGNPRFDRVLSRARQNGQTHLLPASFNHSPTIIAGSIWPADERKILSQLIRIIRSYPELRIILAPHEPTASHIESLEEWAAENGLISGRFSTVQELQQEARVLIIDSIGHLAELYHHCDIAYIGGGFSGSVHNVMEPAVARTAVLFGPDHHNSYEAEQLLDSGGGFSVDSGDEFGRKIRSLLQNPPELQQVREQAYRVIREHAGAAERTVQQLLST